MIKATVLPLALTVLGLGVPGIATGQDAGSAADDLRGNNVTFEEGAVTQDDLDELDSVTTRLQRPGAYFKVVVLAEPVTDYSSADAFAEKVLQDLGGDGRVLVFDTSQVGLASDVDTAAEVAQAQSAAIRSANGTNSFAAGVDAAASQLGDANLNGAEPETKQGGGGSGFPWVLVIVLLLVGGLIAAFFLICSRARRDRSRAGELALSEGEQKVRAAVDAAANQVLALNSVVDLPGAPPEAKEWFRQGAEAFSAVQDELEEADTYEELEVVYPKVLDAGWKLDVAAAIVDGTPKPEKPAPDPLFPPPPVPPPGQPDVAVPQPPEPNYRRQQSSPWLTAAAVAAMSALANRGYRGGGSYRPPMDDSVFGDIFGGGAGGYGGSGRGTGRRGGSGSRPRINLGPGGSGRGMGRRRH